jgi:hypothetical protein
MRAGLAVHAVPLQLAVRAGLAVHAAVFHLAVSARTADSALQFLPPVRTPLVAPHRSPSISWSSFLRVRASSARHDVRSRTRSDVHDALLFTLSQEKEVVAFRELGEVTALLDRS